MRAPISLYRAGFGRMFGRRVLMLEHHGRTSGRWRYVCLEVVERIDGDRYTVVSGFGEQSQWYRNLQADPKCFVSTGSTRRAPATARNLSESEAAEALGRYQDAHPRDWEMLRGVIEKAVGHPVQGLPMVELSLDRPQRDGAHGGRTDHEAATPRKGTN